MANIFILAVADLITTQVRVLTRVAMNQVLVGLLAMALLSIAAAGIVAPLNLAVLGVGWASFAAGVGYLLGTRLLHLNRGEPQFETPAGATADVTRAPSLRTAVIGFALAAVVILIPAPFLAGSAGEIARQLGLSGGFVGMVLVALTISLSEATFSVTTIRAGSDDLAVGNLLGNNCAERRVWYLEPDATLLVLTYAAGLNLTYRVEH